MKTTIISLLIAGGFMFSLLSLISLEVIFQLVNGSVQLAGALSGVSDAEDVGVAGLCLCLRSPWQLFCCKSNFFTIKHFVPASLSSKVFPFIIDSMCGDDSFCRTNGVNSDGREVHIKC